MKFQHRINFSILIVLVLFFEYSVAAVKPVHGKNGVVASADILASQVGINILKQGGNAVDAGVAVAFALAVTYPQAGNIGGGGFMLYREHSGNVYAIDYREKAPAAASRDMYLDASGNVIKNLSTLGYLASGVPGTVAGLYEMHKKFGRLEWQKLIQPAIDLAKNGFVINRYKQDGLAYKLEKFNKFEATKRIFTDHGQALAEGAMLVQTDLANTLSLIQDNGPDGFYKGETARRIAEEMKKNGGLITEQDLADYRPVWRDPLHFTYRNHDIYSMPLPSSGGIVMAEILNILEQTNLHDLGHNSSNTIHNWVEAERLAYADRAKYLGDEDFVDVPVQTLISKAYAKDLRAKTNPWIATRSETIHNELLPGHESLETTHFSVVDRWGNGVSSTYTLNSSYGSCVVIDGTGILMNNEMDDFSIKPGYPNIYGMIGNEANSIQPGKRMLSSMTPSMVVKNDSLLMLVGSPGGSRIITSVAQVISNVIDFGFNVREAVEAPRFHHQWMPDVVYLERMGFTQDVKFNLMNRGHHLKTVEALGDIHAIKYNNSHNEWTGWSDPRRNGMALGY